MAAECLCIHVVKGVSSRIVAVTLGPFCVAINSLVYVLGGHQKCYMVWVVSMFTLLVILYHVVYHDTLCSLLAADTYTEERKREKRQTHISWVHAF